MTTETPIEVTPKQNMYLMEVDGSPKTSRDLLLCFDVSTNTVSKMIIKLRKMGLVSSSRVPHTQGNVWQHELVKSYVSLVEGGLVVVDKPYHRAPTEEIQYVAELRKEGLIGQRLIAKHLERFPYRNPSSVRHLVNTARARGLF